MSEAIYERWDNGEKVTIMKPKRKSKELTPEEVQEIKEYLEAIIAKRLSQE